MGNVRLFGVRGLIGASLVALGACGGGGGGGSPISFSLARGAATLAEDAASDSIEVVLHTTLAALDADVSVEIADAGTGTATSGADYTAFPTQTITFPVGSLEGDMQTVVFDPLDDSLVEGANETVRLRLQNATGGALAGTTQFVATLTDIHAALIGFATAAGTTPDEASGAQSVALELECGAGVTLGVAASVRVSDLRTGSAVPPSDYSAFAARTVTFPSGSADGAVQTVSVQVADDGALEGDETVELALSSPSSTCTLGAIDTHVLTIVDDDLAGNSAFLASEGAAGTGNSLVYDEAVPLGSQTVGAGPNAGTLLRVTNGGGQDMTLGAPRLAGTHPNDFALEIESTGFAPPGASGSSLASSAGAEREGEPGYSLAVPAVAEEGPGLVLRLDRAGIAELARLERVTLHDFALPDRDPVTLVLDRRPLPVSGDARLVIDGEDVAGGLRTLLGDLQLWSGTLEGMPGSRVFLALTETSAQGFIELPEAEGFVHLVADEPGRVRLLSEAGIAALGLAPPEDFCAGERYVPGALAPLLEGNPDSPTTGALTVADCRLALETDWQLYQKFSSDTELTTYVVGLVGAVSDQYVTDVQTTLSIAYLGIHTTSNDGWDTQEVAGSDAGDLLDEFQAAWGQNWPAQADLAHFLSGDNLGGGVAYVNVLCSPGFGFGVSGSLSGTIDWSAWTGQAAGFTWDFVVLAHELGHNFGSQHTHSYCPPLDQCYSNCNGNTVCTRGTLMSYCHVSCGGMSNIDLHFHPVCANIMRQNVNSSCLDDAALLPGDFVQYRLRFNPLNAPAGARSATLEFAHDASNVTQPFRVQLSGTAN